MKKKVSTLALALFIIAATACAATVNVGGTVNVSTLDDNADVKLIGATTLNVDANKTLASISGNYALTIQGSNRLEIKSGGHGISVSSLELSLSGTTNAVVVIDSKKDGLHVDGSVIVRSGRLFIGVGSYSSAIYSINGNVVIHSGFLEFSGGTSSEGIYTEKGNIVVYGGTVYSSCPNHALFAKDGMVSVSGDVEAISGMAIWAKKGIAINGGKTKIRAWYSLYSQADIKIQNAEVEVTNIEGVTNPAAIFAKTGISINNATVTAKTEKTEATDPDMIVSESGDIVIGSDATVTATGIYCGVYAKNGSITIAGNVNAKGLYAIWAKNGIQITGGKTKAEGPMAICTPAMLTIQNAEVEAKGWDNPGGAALFGGNGIVVSNGTVTATAAPGRDAIISGSGQITLNGTITASGGKTGISAKSNIIIEGGSVNAQGSSSAVYSNAGTITIKLPFVISPPSGGKVSGKTIVDSSGNTAKSVVIKAGITGIEINATNFPNLNFQNYVSSNCDKDQNGYLSDAEIAAVTSMNVSDKSIFTLKGIEYFTALKTLRCSKNKLAKLDVSKLTKLEELSCNENQLITLDVSKNTKLTKLYCYGNKINGDGMQALVNSLPKVTNGDLYIYFNWTLEENVITKPQVAAAKAKGWTVRVAQGSIYEGVDPGIAINSTNFSDANFRSFVSSNYDKDKDGYLSTSEIAAVTEINVNRKSISKLKGIEHFTALTRLICFANNLTTLDVSKNVKLTSLDCSYNNLTSLTLSSGNTALKTVEIYGNRLNGTAMQTLVNSLPRATNGSFYAIDTTYGNEQNVITKAQVNTAKGKGWKIYDYQGDYSYSEEYAGSETTPVENIEADAEPQNARWYTIDGKKLPTEPTQKGIYIRNGKKIVK